MFKNQTWGIVEVLAALTFSVLLFGGTLYATASFRISDELRLAAIGRVEVITAAVKDPALLEPALALQEIETPAPQPVRLLFLGDIMLDRDIAKLLEKTSLGDWVKNWRTPEELSEYDLVVANLEGPFTETRIKTSKTIAFRFDPELLTDLKAALSLDAVSIANNHTLDMGQEGLKNSKNYLEAAAIKYFGLSDGVSDDSVQTFLIGDQKITLIGFNDTFPKPSEDELVKKIEGLKEPGTVIVFIHWGVEYKTVHSQAQEKLAEKLIDAGADLIVGSHPHVVQDVGEYQEKTIVYSLGNFIFDQFFSKATMRGAALEVTFLGGEYQTKTIPVVISKDGLKAE
ncbi:MAG: CapA family protein [bacterium]